MLQQIFTYLPLAALLPFAMRGSTTKSIAAAAIIVMGSILALIASGEVIIYGSSATMPGMDSLSALFIATIALNGSACAIYSVGYLKKQSVIKNHTKLALHLCSMVILFFSMINIAMSRGAYQFLIWWELMTLATFLLLLFNGRRKEVMHAAMGFVVLMHVGFFVLLAAFASSGAAILNQGAISIGVWVLFLVGFGLKSAIFPLHIWLPVTYWAAPSHISAMLSGVSINLGIYGIMRATLALNGEAAYGAGVLLFIIGITSALFGASRAAAEDELKRLLAYSSIENVGIILMGIGFGTIGRWCDSDFMSYVGYGAAMVHTMGHANYKTLLFMCAGAVEQATQTTMLNRLGGLLKRMQITGVLFLIGTLAICSVPALVGFSSEFILMGGLFRSIAHGEQVVISIVGVIVLALVGGLVVMTFVKAFGIAMLGTPRSCEAREAGEANLWMLLPAALPVAGIIAGALLYPRIVLENADTLFGARYYSEPLLHNLTTVELMCAGVVLATVILMALKWLLNRIFKVEVTEKPTWGCGFTAPNKRIQYSASSMNRDLKNVLSTHRGENDTREFDDSELFPNRDTLHPAPINHERHSITHFFSHLMHRWSARLALFQTGKTNDYIMHALILLIIILVLTLFGIL